MLFDGLAGKRDELNIFAVWSMPEKQFHMPLSSIPFAVSPHDFQLTFALSDREPQFCNSDIFVPHLSPFLRLHP